MYYWRKSSRSGAGNGGGQCVEIGCTSDGRFAIRDSKAPATGLLSLTSVQSSEFLASAKAGRFDLPR
ncbi:DUF397 domain-containing protein [Actinoalloteichus hymeniacidonis]|uniref:DUF397 domain-containing protein n=1 Tax=Actinoalloteichus hymeniacidonis TaxID=340345 RepID=UPI000A05D9FA|nr:DUF397 domain-containing protein [Actinoalloteichus hymeniacidonis]